MIGEKIIRANNLNENQVFHVIPRLYNFFFYELHMVMLDKIRLQDTFIYKSGVSIVSVLCYGGDNQGLMGNKNF